VKQHPIAARVVACPLVLTTPLSANKESASTPPTNVATRPITTRTVPGLAGQLCNLAAAKILTRRFRIESPTAFLRPSILSRPAQFAVSASTQGRFCHLDQAVGVAGFEPTASSSRTKRATKLRHTPLEATTAYRTGLSTGQTARQGISSRRMSVRIRPAPRRGPSDQAPERRPTRR
jgi:hypothetical protein